MKITVVWEEMLVNVHGSTSEKISSAMAMSNLAQLLDNYIHTGKRHHITAKHKSACI
jgi:hypothetical protein